MTAIQDFVLTFYHNAQCAQQRKAILLMIVISRENSEIRQVNLHLSI